jgi:hypothetical protein
MLLRGGREASRVLRAAGPRDACPEARGQGSRHSPARRVQPWTTPGSGAVDGPPVAEPHSPGTAPKRSVPVTERAMAKGLGGPPEDAAQAALARHCQGGRVGSVGSGSGSGPGLGGGSPGKGEGKGEGGSVGGLGCCEATAVHSPGVVGEAAARIVGAGFDGPADAQHTTGWRHAARPAM